VIFDISDLDRDKWSDVVAPALHVLFHENAGYGIRHIFFDEAAEFAPQSTKMIKEIYEEVERMGRIGGNRKLGMTFINNRPESLSKSLTGLCEGLFLHRQKDEIALGKLKKWLNTGSINNRQEIIQSLATLKPGQCWVWTRDSNAPNLVQMPRKNSYHPNRRDFGLSNSDVVSMDDLPDIIQEMKGEIHRWKDDYRWTPPPPPEVVMPVVEKTEINIEIDWNTISDSNKDVDYRIYQKASITWYGGKPIKEMIDNLIKRGYTQYVGMNKTQGQLISKNDIHPFWLSGDIQCQYAEMILRRLGLNS
jgi:hypothetical protein